MLKFKMSSENLTEKRKLDDTDETDKEMSPSASPSKINFRNYFSYAKNQNEEKIGRCLLCKANKVMKQVKMKNSNTSGLKYHLSKDHRKEYEILFKTQSSHKTLLANRKPLDLYATVSKSLYIPTLTQG